MWTRLLPFLAWLPGLHRGMLGREAWVGLNGAILALPQSMAYALIAGLPAEYGLYAAMLPVAIACLWGSSRYLVSGPTAAISVLLFSSVAPLAPLGSPQYVQAVLLLTFLAGAFQWLLGVLRVGSLVNFVSHSVMLGFTLGAALLIVLGQLPYLLGLAASGEGAAPGNGWRLLARFAEFDGPSLLVGGFSFALSLLVRRLRPRWPALLLGLLGGATLVWALPGTFASVAHVQALSSALPGWNPLVFDSRSILDLLPAAVACGMLGLVTSLSIARALAARPGEVVRFLVFEKDDPLGLVISAPSLVPPPENGHMQPFDARTGEFFDALPPPGGFMYLMLKLHTDLFLGLPGYLFLGLMGLLLVASLVSGVVVYTPFMRKLDFATVRAERSRRLKWLDLHNLLGIVTLSWVLVVGVTGVINTLALPILMLWQGGQLAEMTAPYKDAPPLQRLGSLDAALATARRAAPDMEVSFVGFPGTQFSSQHHYAVFMRGNTPLTERLLKPALIDAQTGELTDMREMPLYVKTLLLSQPLHFGDYGGMPLKIVWALLDLISIVILASGLYLWLGRRKTPLEKRLAELPGGSLATEGKA